MTPVATMEELLMRQSETLLHVYCRYEAARWRERLWECISDASRPPSVLFVYPTAGMARRVRRQWARRFGVLPGNIVLSVREFEECLLSASPRRLIETSQLSALLHMLRATQSCAETLEEQFRAFFARDEEEGRTSFPDGVYVRLAREIADTVARDACEGRPQPDSEPLPNAIQALVRTVSSVLDAHGFALYDAELIGLWRTLPKEVFSSLFGGADHIIFDNFLTLEPQHWSMVRWFAARRAAGDAAPPMLHLFFDYAPAAEHARYPHLAAIWSDLTQRYGAVAHCSPQCPCGSPTGEPDVRIASAVDRTAEVARLAQLIRDDVHMRQSAARDALGICVTSLHHYAGLIRSVFHDHNIPYRCPYWQTLDRSLVWNFLVSLVRAARARCEGRLTLEVLDDLLGHPFVAVVLREWRGHRYGYGLLRLRFAEATTLPELIDALDGWLRRTPAATAGVDPSRELLSDEEEAWGDPWVQKRAMFERLRGQLLSLDRWLGDFARARSYGEWSHVVEKTFGETLGALSRGVLAEDRGEGAFDGITANDVRHVTAMLARLIALARQLALFAEQFGCSREIDLALFFESLSLLASADRIADRVRSEPGVEILTPMEAFGGSFDELILIGLTEGELPNLEQGRGRAAVAPSRLTDNERSLSEQRYLFDRLVAKSKRVWLFYPLREEENVLLPSQFLDELVPREQPLRCDISTPSQRAGESCAESARQRTEQLAQQLVSGEDPTAGLAPAAPSTLPTPILNLAWVGAADSALAGEDISPFEGRIVSRPLVETCARWLSARIFSATELQWLLDCPLAYFFRYGLGVKPPDNEALLASQELGTIAHTILFRFMKEMKERQFQPLEFDPALAKERLLEIAWTVLENSVTDSLARRFALGWDLLGASYLDLALSRGAKETTLEEWAEELRRLTAPSLRASGRLLHFLEMELQQRQTSATTLFPLLLEWQFGVPRSASDNDCDENSQLEPILLEAPTRSFWLRGKIDRVDVDGAGTLFVLYDYKTSSTVPSRKDLETLRRIQLPLYAAALSRSGRVPPNCSEMGYIWLARKGTKLVAIEPAEELLSLLVERLARAIDAAAAGRFYALGAVGGPVGRTQLCKLGPIDCPYFGRACPGWRSASLRRKLLRIRNRFVDGGDQCEI